MGLDSGTRLSADTYLGNNLSANNGFIQNTDKMAFGFVKSGNVYDKDLNNYNFAKIEEYLAPMFTQNGDGAGGTQNATAIKTQLLNLIYPIGSVYQSFKPFSPATFLGGTWKQLDGQFLFAATENVDNITGSGTYTTITGGTKTLQLINHTHDMSHNHTNSHSHTISSTTGLLSGNDNVYRNEVKVDNSSKHYTFMSYSSNSAEASGLSKKSTASSTGTTNSTTSEASRTTTENTGTVNTENTANMPPYLNVYMWVRTA